MKKFLAGFLAVLCVFGFSGCGMSLTAKKTISDSEIFKKSDINNAMNKVCGFFALNFDGCVLLELEYDENYSKERADEWAKQYDSDEAIVLLSKFYVAKEGDGSLEEGETYKNWNWILVRNSGGIWKLKTWGYA